MVYRNSSFVCLIAGLVCANCQDERMGPMEAVARFQVVSVSGPLDFVEDSFDVRPTMATNLTLRDGLRSGLIADDAVTTFPHMFLEDGFVNEAQDHNFHAACRSANEPPPSAGVLLLEASHGCGF
jgi:hypothetical protein